MSDVSCFTKRKAGVLAPANGAIGQGHAFRAWLALVRKRISAIPQAFALAISTSTEIEAHKSHAR